MNQKVQSSKFEVQSLSDRERYLIYSAVRVRPVSQPPLFRYFLWTFLVCLGAVLIGAVLVK